MNSECKQPKKYLLFGIDIVIHIVILFSIISMFFMFVISKKETNAINNQISENANNAIDKIINNFDKNTLSELQILGKTDFIQKMKSKYEKENLYVKTHNKWLFKTIWYTNGVLITTSLIVILLLMYQCNTCINIKEILLTNIVTFLFIGTLEVLFFMNVGKKYIPSNPSVVVNTFFDEILKKMN